MITGKTLFAHAHGLPAMDYFHADRLDRSMAAITWSSGRISCAGQYRSMAFAQLTYRESLRDIEYLPLAVHASKLYHMGFRQPVFRRSTLAWMPTKGADWRIHAALAQRLITQARTLYVRPKNWGWT